MEIEDANPLWVYLPFKLSLTAALHPIEYAKVLMQVGHEPLPPYLTYSLFQKPVLGLPNILKYVGHIKQIDGFQGCFRGLSPRLYSAAIQCIAYDNVKATAYIKLEKYFHAKEEEYGEWMENLHELLSSLIAKATLICATQPFRVIALRTMVQFVGREQVYDGVMDSVTRIIKTEGIFGLFRGLVPRLIGELTMAVMVGMGLMILKVFYKEKEISDYATIPIQFTVSSLTYPFQLVEVCMAVNNCGLEASSLPNMPIFSSWLDCWRYLQESEQLMRGSQMFFRRYYRTRVFRKILQK